MKFEKHWIFKVARWTRNRWLKINESLTVSNGIRASSFEIWTANLTQLLTKLTELHLWRFKLEIVQSVGPPKPNSQMWTFLTWDFFSFLCFYFLVKKIKTCWVYKNTVFAKWEKYKVSWNFHSVLLLIFKVVYRDHLTQLLPFAMDFVAKGQRLVRGHVG